MSEIKYMEVDEFVSVGFLQEANRLFFHPRGLALAVGVLGEEEFDSWLDAVTETFIDETRDGLRTSVRQAIRDLVAVTGHRPGRRLHGVWDYRSDPEGVIFDDGILSRRKAIEVGEELARHVPARVNLWGSQIQPLPREDEE